MDLKNGIRIIATGSRASVSQVFTAAISKDGSNSDSSYSSPLKTDTTCMRNGRAKFSSHEDHVGGVHRRRISGQRLSHLAQWVFDESR
jgi:hypothetical protein